MIKNNILNKIVNHNPSLSWIKDNTVLLALHGSRAYNCHLDETSDYDYKGICIPEKKFFLGSQYRFEQAELSEPDSVIYEIRKFFTLATNGNPNILEVLFGDDDDIVHIDSIGEEIRSHRDKFLSKRVKATFAGYAHAQLKKAKLHRKHFINPPKAPPTRKEMGLPEQTLIPRDQLMAAESEVRKELEKLNLDFLDELPEAVKISMQNTMVDMLSELKVHSDAKWSAAARKVGLSDNFIEIMQKERAYTNAKTEWDNYINWKENRNRARFESELKFQIDTKNAYHLVRLLRMCREILTTGKVIVKRPDREELLAIRRGEWSYEKIIDYAEEQNNFIKNYNGKDFLPAAPDSKFLDDLCINLIEKSLSKYSLYSIKKKLKIW
jgi:hypothetical protein